MATKVHLDYRKAHFKRSNIADTITGLCWISVALVIALFLADHGIEEMQTPAGLWTAIGQVTGLIGTDLLLIQLILAARLPAIDQSIGHDRAIEAHQKLGKPVLIMLALHAITLTIGYGLNDKLSFIPEAVSMLSDKDLLLAGIGLALIGSIVITSLTLIRRKLDYDMWFIIHLTAYIAILASIPHQFSYGAIFGEGTIARWYWIILYGVTFGSILLFRVIKPIVSSLRHDLTVSEVRTEAPGVITLTIKGRELNRLTARSGQFFMWRFWTAGLWWHAHPFSLSASPTNSSLRITIRALGNGSEKIQRIQPGTRVSIQGPYGLFTEMARTSRKLVLIAAGIGITPIRALLEDSAFNPGEATVIIRKPSIKDNYLMDEIQEICAQRGARLYVMTGPRSKDPENWRPGNSSFEDYELKDLVPSLQESDVYICGPAHWSRLVAKDAKKSGLANHQIHWERFNW